MAKLFTAKGHERAGGNMIRLRVDQVVALERSTRDNAGEECPGVLGVWLAGHEEAFPIPDPDGSVEARLLKAMEEL